MAMILLMMDGLDSKKQLLSLLRGEKEEKKEVVINNYVNKERCYDSLQA